MEPFVAKVIYVVGCWFANFAIRVPHIRARKGRHFRSNRNSTADMALLVAAGAGGFVVPLVYVFTPLLAFADYSPPLWCSVLGVALLVAGDWAFWRAHRDLGVNWSPTLEIRDPHTLVTAGIYRRVRHPMYSSLWLLVIAQALILPNYVAGFSGVLPFALLYLVRARKKERMMAGEFGEEYARYCERTGRLIPRLPSR
jgi:protein-S-isoprenylcysteine O-methyltransferase Ste14